MTPERWQQIERVFLDAVEINSPEELTRFLSEACGTDDELRGAVEKLLEQDIAAENLLSEPLLKRSGLHYLAAQLENSDALIGRKIGAYLIEHEIGRGGMGAVYRATRDDGEFRQTVAVKLIKRGMDTDFILRRFRRERQILASLNHPFISRLLDGGTTSEGSPYFVMEFVAGESLYNFCDRRELSVRERLELFLKICQAVQFAHQNSVVHRDLKPSNILVKEDGTPKLLDFGIAKVLNPDNFDETIEPTATAMRLMTPDYASPEQICGAPVTAASDVYSLGVVLYELLTGHRPYRFKNRTPHEITRVVCEEPPERPTGNIARRDTLLPMNEATTVLDVCRSRGKSRIEDLQRELSGDLEKITLKSLRKEPLERYRTVAELSDDVGRYLSGEPVEADEFYGVPVTGSALVNIAEPSFSSGEKSVAVLPLKLLRIALSENTGDEYLCIGLADALISRLSNVRRFNVRPTSSVLAYQSRDVDAFAAGRELNVDFVVDGNLRRVGGRLRISAQLLSVKENSTRWGQTFDEEFADVLTIEDVISEKITKSLVPQLTDDDELQMKKRGTDNPEAFESYLRGRFHWNSFTEEGFAKAIAAFDQAVALDPGYALAYAGIADYYIWLGVYGVRPSVESFRLAQRAARRAIELDAELSDAHASLGSAILCGEFDWKQGEKSCRRALELNPHNATAHIWFAFQLFMEARFDEGEFHARRAVELDPLSPVNSYNLGWCLYFARKFDESIAQQRKTIHEHPLYAIAYYGLAWSLRATGEHDEAVGAARRAVELSDKSPFWLTMLAQTLAAAGIRDEAREILRGLLQTSETRFVSPYHLALIYCFLKEPEKAFDYLERSLKIREAWIVWSAVEPVFENLRRDARFQKILRTMNYPSKNV